MKKILLIMLLCMFNLPAMAQKTILIVGDSISAAYGMDVQKGWVNLLQQKLNNEKYAYTVINASISGDTTSNGLARIAAALQQYRPAITILQLGGNDGLRALDLNIIKHNLNQMVVFSKQSGSKVLILGLQIPPNYGPVYLQQYQKIFTDIAKENAVRVVPNFLTKIEANDALFQADRIHPTEAAQAQIMETVWNELKPMLD